MGYTFTTLTGAKTVEGSIRAWCNHASVPAEDVLTEAQAFIYERLRTFEMRVTLPFTAAIGASSLTLPADFLAPIKLVIDNGDPDGLPYRHEAIFTRSLDEDGDLTEGTPSCWTLHNDAILFDCELDEAIAGDLWYYAIPDPLSADNQTNFLTRKYPTLLRRACMMFGYEFLKRTDVFKDAMVMTEQAIERANVSSDSARMGQEF